jgi:hypothetical protein
VDISTGEEKFRIIGIYAPESRSWKWEDVSQFITPKCAIYGDFNVDFKKDNTKAEVFLTWTDAHFLASFVPNASTSLRLDRTIDFAFCSGFSIDIQTYNNPYQNYRKCSWSKHPLESFFLYFLNTSCCSLYQILSIKKISNCNSKGIVIIFILYSCPFI